MNKKIFLICVYSFIGIYAIKSQDLNTVNGSGFNICTGFSPINAPAITAINGFQSQYDANYKWQFVNTFPTNNYYIRSYTGANWSNWFNIWHSGNFDPSNLNCSTINVLSNINNTKGLKLLYQGTWGTPDFATNFRFIDISSTEEGNIFQMNSYGVGIGYNPPNYASRDRLYVKGRVGILTTIPQYELDVYGTIHAREVKVDLTGWSDFVFHPSYKLKPLTEVEQFIKINGHLQDVPSAAEVQQNGVNMGEMQAKLLQKVEETTLYLIEMSKQMEILKKQNEQLQEDNETLKSKLNELQQNITKGTN